MARQRSKRLSEARTSNRDAIVQQKDKEVVDAENDSEDLRDKDEEEEALDRLVLGNNDTFMEELRRQVDGDEDEEEDEDKEPEEAPFESAEEDNELNIENVDDAQLFYLDSAPSALDETTVIRTTGLEDELSQGDVPAWDDSDDDRLMVSLAGNTRLRKLRVYEGEDMVSGKEYIRRLRKQFERLHPRPEWAIRAERSTKRRRRSSASDVSDSSFTSDNDEGEEMDIDEGDLSTLPLARMLQNSHPLTQLATLPSSKRVKFRPGTLDIQRTRDISTIQPSAIGSLSFHPTHPLLLSSGLSSTLYLHHISPTAIPTPNPLLTSVHIKHTPIHTSAFHPPSGDKIFLSGRRRYYHTWDLPSGTIQKISHASLYSHKEEQRSLERFKLSPCGTYLGFIGTSKKGGGGVVNILDANTSQWIAAARIEGRNGVADFAWWRDGTGITIVGSGGVVGEWSMESRSFVALWNDEGAVNTTVVQLGGRFHPDGNAQSPIGTDRWVAIGSTTGIVNIYDRRAWLDSSSSFSSSSFSSSTTAAGSHDLEPKIPPHPHPHPTKTFQQLTTPISFLEFSPDGQLMLFASRKKKDALRLVHLPSCTVYRNWPTSETPLGRVSAVALGVVGPDRQGQGEGEGGSQGPGQLMLAVGNEAGKIRLWEIRA